MGAEAHDDLRSATSRTDGVVGQQPPTGERLPIVDREERPEDTEAIFLFVEEDWRDNIVWMKASPLETTTDHNQPSLYEGENAIIGGFIIEDDGMTNELSTGFVLVEDNGAGFAEPTEGDGSCGFCNETVPSGLNFGIFRMDLEDFLNYVEEWRQLGGLSDPEDFGGMAESVGLCSVNCGLGDQLQLLKELA